LEECFIASLIKQEKHLVKLPVLIEIEQHIKHNKLFTGRLASERRAKALFRFPHIRNLIYQLQARPYLRLICGFASQHKISLESTFSRSFVEFTSQILIQVLHNSTVQEY